MVPVADTLDQNVDISAPDLVVTGMIMSARFQDYGSGEVSLGICGMPWLDWSRLCWSGFPDNPTPDAVVAHMCLEDHLTRDWCFEGRSQTLRARTSPTSNSVLHDVMPPT